jgi:WD40 repeat protein
MASRIVTATNAIDGATRRIAVPIPIQTLSRNRAATVSGMRRRFGLEVTAIALVLIACTVGPSERPSPPATASLSPSLGPTVSVSSTPAPAASASSAAEPLPNVHTTPLGQVTGTWLFYGVRIPRPEPNRIDVQIVAVPVGGGAAKIVVAFDAAIPPRDSNGGPEIFDSTPYLRRQFSPDGKRMVFSIDGKLVVVDLVTGRATPLGVRGYYPSWSRDGSLIAFVFEKPVADAGATPPPAIGVVPAAGGSPRELTAVGYVRHSSVEWSPDGSRIFFSYGVADATLDATMEIASGRITPIPTSGPSYAHWRVGSPELAIATQSCVGGDLGSGSTPSARIVGMDEGTGSVRTLVDVAEPCEVQLRDPRWNPAVADELLYIAARADDYETHVLNIRTGNDTRLPISAYEATWTWDGSAIAYLAKIPGSSFGSALRVWKRDGSGETELGRASGGEAFFSIASVSY